MPEPSVFQRLKERKLVQWALAYLAGAFVVFQAVDALESALGLTPTVQRAILVIVGVGFFIALVFAWYHGEKGRQRVSGPELLMVAALLVVAGTGLSILRDDGGVPEQIETAASPAAEDDRPSIAVLPLDNFSPDPADAWFTDGMQEQLVAMLAKIKGLSVRGRTSTMRYRNDPPPLPVIAQELGVSFVIEGSVRIAGGQVSFTAQLLDAVRDEHLWAQEYDREFSVDDVLNIHREIARNVVSEVRTALEPEDEDRLESIPTHNTEAYEEYLKGRFHWGDRSAEGLETALEHFRRAIALDSSYAQAYSGLADGFAVLPYYSGRSDPRSAFAHGLDAAQEAIRLAPDLAEAHASLGYLRLVSRRDWEGAEAELRRAVALDPSYPTGHHWLSDVLAFSGRLEKAIAEEQRSLELDPLSFISNFALGHRYYWARDFERAASQYEQTVDLHPGNFMGWAALSELMYLMGDPERGALYGRRGDELFGLDSSLVDLLTEKQSHFYETGEPSALPPEIDAVSGYTPPMRARSAMLMGDTAKALYWIERSVEQEWPDLLVTRVSPLYDSLRSNPRFQALLRGYAGDVRH